MIDMSTLTVAMYDLLNENSALDILGCTTERSTTINADPGRCPWIGIYPDAVDSEPRTAVAKSWMNHAGLQIVIQASSLADSGTAASDELEELIAAVLDVINDDLPLSGAGTGIRITRIRREYSYVLFDSEGTGDLFMPQAVIKVSLEARS
jgi:hypothetical protein